MCRYIYVNRIHDCVMSDTYEDFTSHPSAVGRCGCTRTCTRAYAHIVTWTYTHT